MKTQTENEFWGCTPWLPQRGWQDQHVWNPADDEDEEEEGEEKPDEGTITIEI